MWRVPRFGAIFPLGVREDVDERIDERTILFTRSTPLLELDEIHAAVEQSPVVGQFVLDFDCGAPVLAELVEGHVVEPFEVLGVEDTVETSAMLRHGNRLPAGGCDGRIWIDG